MQGELTQLAKLAFHRREYCEADIIRFHAIRQEKGPAAVAQIESLYLWMLAPITLWPLNIQAVFQACMEEISAGRSLDNDMQFLLQTLPAPPDEKVCAVVAAHEHDVQRGHYEQLVTTTVKFDAAENELARNSDLHREWERIKAYWDLDSFRESNGVIRRTLNSERNLRQSFALNWKKRAERFQAIFDAFCLRWNLYGMQDDTPLLMKLSVNMTPHGTMIFIPAYWSFDAKRDVRWDAVTKLHRARATKKQGAVLKEGAEQRRAMALKLKTLDQEVTRLRLKGQKRHAFLCEGLGLVEGTDSKRIARLRKEFADL